MPDSFKMATLFPDDAMRVRRVAEPLRVVEKEEKVSLWWWFISTLVCVEREREGEEGRLCESNKSTYRAINNMLIARTIIYIYRHAAERRDL
jgi:hypothetical protein